MGGGVDGDWGSGENWLREVPPVRSDAGPIRGRARDVIRRHGMALGRGIEMGMDK